MQACRLAASTLACRRGDRVLFTGLSFALNTGDAVHVGGANGVGKSSLIRLLAGLLRPLWGTIERTGSAALLDDRAALDPHLPLARALGFWSRIDGSSDSDNLARVGLADLAEVPVRYLSTGQAKRAGIARLLSQRAPIWLLDEPLNGLDTAAAALLLALVARHRADGGLCVIASHQPLDIADLVPLDLTRHVPADAPIETGLA